MWRATIGYDVNAKNDGGDDDDWETDPDFIVIFFFSNLKQLSLTCLLLDL